MDYSPPGSSVHGILQARILEWVPFPSLDLPDSGIESRSPILQADSLLSEPPEIVLPSPECHSIEITQCAAFSAWFLSLGHMYSQILHILSWLIAHCF